MINETGDRNIFKVPEHYFEDFAASMEKRIDEFEADEALISDAPITTNIHPMMRLRPLLSIAAMFIVIAFSMGLIFHFTSNSSAELKAEETSSTDKIPTAEDYLISSVGTYGITQYYVETEANE